MGNISGVFKYTVFIIFFATVSFIYAQSSEIQITTSSPEALSQFIEGRNLLENINNTRAAELFDKAISQDPNFALAHLYRSLSFIGGFNASREHLDKALALGDKVTGGEKDLILFWKASGDGNELEQKVYVDKLLSSFPKDKRVQNLAGVYFYGQNDFKTALQHLEKATEIDQNFAPSYNMIGYCQSNLENFSASEQAFKKYIELIPDNPNPYDSYAELLMKRGRYDESIEQYQMAYSKDNTFLTSLFGQGNNYILKGDFIAARSKYKQAYDEATDINTKLAALFWRATSFVHQGKIDEAMTTLDEQRKLADSKNLKTNVINNLNLRGFILTEAGMPAKGILKLKEASELIKNSTLPEEVKKNLSIQTDLNMSYTLAADNNIIEADNTLEKCRNEVMKRGNQAEIQNLHQKTALIDIQKGDYVSAITNFEKSNLVDAPLSWYNLSIAYEKTGNTKSAAEYRNKAKSANVNGVGLAIVREKSKE